MTTGAVARAFVSHYLADRPPVSVDVVHVDVPGTADLTGLADGPVRSVRRIGTPALDRRSRVLRGWRLDAGRRAADVVVVGPAAALADPVPWATARELARVVRPGGFVVVDACPGADRADEPVADWVGPLLHAGFDLLERSRPGARPGAVVVARRPAPGPSSLVRRLARSGPVRRAAATASLVERLGTPPTGADLASAHVRRELGIPVLADLEGDDRAGAYWDTHVALVRDADPERAQRAEWRSHARAQSHLERRAGGHLTSWIVGRAPTGANAVSIGCGRAETEIDLLASGHLRTLELFDISAESLAEARRISIRRGVADRVTVHRGPFRADAVGGPADVVLFLSSLHHVERLEQVLDDVAAVLAPGGALLADEYVGPARFALPDDHLRHARSVHRLLHPSLRMESGELPVMDPATVAAVDPTEAVRSDEILPLLLERFDDVEVAAIGGGLVFPLWYALDHDALFETELGDAAVAWMLEQDAILTDAGLLPPYFAYLAASGPRSAPASERPADGPVEAAEQA